MPDSERPFHDEMSQIEDIVSSIVPSVPPPATLSPPDSSPVSQSADMSHGGDASQGNESSDGPAPVPSVETSATSYNDANFDAAEAHFLASLKMKLQAAVTKDQVNNMIEEYSLRLLTGMNEAANEMLKDNRLAVEKSNFAAQMAVKASNGVRNLQTATEKMETDLNDLDDQVGDVRARVRGLESRVWAMDSAPPSPASPEHADGDGVCSASVANIDDLMLASLSSTVKRIEADRLRADDEYWSRCLHVTGFNLNPSVPYQKIYSSVLRKLKKIRVNVGDWAKSFFVVGNGGLRMEFNSRVEAHEALRQFRRELRIAGNQSVHVEYCVPPRFMKDKMKLTLIGMRMKRVGLINNFKVRTRVERGVSTLKLLPFRRRHEGEEHWPRASAVHPETNPWRRGLARPAFVPERSYGLSDIMDLDDLINDNIYGADSQQM